MSDAIDPSASRIKFDWKLPKPVEKPITFGDLPVGAQFAIQSNFWLYVRAWDWALSANGERIHPAPESYVHDVTYGGKPWRPEGHGEPKYPTVAVGSLDSGWYRVFVPPDTDRPFLLYVPPSGHEGDFLFYTERGLWGIRGHDTRVILAAPENGGAE